MENNSRKSTCNEINKHCSSEEKRNAKLLNKYSENRKVKFETELLATITA